MARNGSGTYNKPVADFVNGTTISETAMNTLIDDMASALTQSISKDGQTAWTGADDHNGQEIILDVDGDTSITADTDDKIDIKVGGVDTVDLRNGSMRLINTDASTTGYTLYLDHSRAAPANNDIVSRILSNGNDSGGNPFNYGAVQVKALTIANGAEVGQLIFSAGGAAGSAEMTMDPTNGFNFSYLGHSFDFSGGALEISAGLGVHGTTPPAQASHIANPSGGAIVDSEARSAINAILVVLENIGFVAAS